MINLIKKPMKYFYKFILTMLIFEYFSINRKDTKKILKINTISSKNEVKKKKFLKNYFKDNHDKSKRFKNSKFVFLKNRNEIIVSGWITSKKNNYWNIEEIDRKLNTKERTILYDFETSMEYRNKGYYTLILKLIQNKYLKKKLLIYTQSSNKPSIRAIKKSGFKFKGLLKKF